MEKKKFHKDVTGIKGLDLQGENGQAGAVNHGALRLRGDFIEVFNRMRGIDKMDSHSIFPSHKV